LDTTGWVKLHRKIMVSEDFLTLNTTHKGVFIMYLCAADRKEHPGYLLKETADGRYRPMSLRDRADICVVSKTTIERADAEMMRRGMIRMTRIGRDECVQVTNWKDHQGGGDGPGSRGGQGSDCPANDPLLSHERDESVPLVGHYERDSGCPGNGTETPEALGQQASTCPSHGTRGVPEMGQPPLRSKKYFKKTSFLPSGFHEQSADYTLQVDFGKEGRTGFSIENTELQTARQLLIECFPETTELHEQVVDRIIAEHRKSERPDWYIQQCAGTTHDEFYPRVLKGETTDHRKVMGYFRSCWRNNWDRARALEADPWTRMHGPEPEHIIKAGDYCGARRRWMEGETGPYNGYLFPETPYAGEKPSVIAQREQEERDRKEDERRAQEAEIRKVGHVAYDNHGKPYMSRAYTPEEMALREKLERRLAEIDELPAGERTRLRNEAHIACGREWIEITDSGQNREQQTGGVEQDG